MAKEILLRKKMKRPLVANLGKLYFVPLTNSLFRIENALLMKYLYFITIPVFWLFFERFRILMTAILKSDALNNIVYDYLVMFKEKKSLEKNRKISTQ